MKISIKVTEESGSRKGNTTFDFNLCASLPEIGCRIENVLMQASGQGKLPGIKAEVLAPDGIILFTETAGAEEALQRIINVLKGDSLTSDISITVER